MEFESAIKNLTTMYLMYKEEIEPERKKRLEKNVQDWAEILHVEKIMKEFEKELAQVKKELCIKGVKDEK